MAVAVPDRIIRPISLAALTVLEVTPLEAVRIAAACGYNHVGLRALPATPAEHDHGLLTRTGVLDAVARALADEGVGVLDVEIVRLSPHMDWAVIERVLDLAAKLGAGRLLVADNDPEPARAHDTLAALAQRAAGYGVPPHLEFMPWTDAPDLAAARQRINGIPNCKILVDAFHLARSGGCPEDLADADPAVGYLQLCDIAGPIPPMPEILAEARANRLFPGEGDIDLAGLLARLPGLPVSLEVPADRLRDAGATAFDRAKLAIEATRALIAPERGG